MKESRKNDEKEWRKKGNERRKEIRKKGRKKENDAR